MPATSATVCYSVCRRVVVRWRINGKWEVGNGTRLLGLRDTSLSFPPAQEGEMNAIRDAGGWEGAQSRGPASITDAALRDSQA